MQRPISPRFNPVNFYLGFSGRINRQQFWLYGVLPIILVQIVASILMSALAGRAFSTALWAAISGQPRKALIIIGVVGLAWVVLQVGIVWVNLAVQIKRWHDRDKSAWWIFIAMIPIAGPVWALVELGLLPGTPSQNRYGSAP